jgi:phosphoglycerate dehydrogenase-like enzyme
MGSDPLEAKLQLRWQGPVDSRSWGQTPRAKSQREISNMGSDPRGGVAVASHSFGKHATLRQELMARHGDVRFNETGEPLRGDALVAFLRGHARAITGLEILDDDLFAAVPELRVVSKYGVGLDMIDLAAARRYGVSVRWTPGVNRQAVAELTIAFMIALCRSLVPLARSVTAGGWTHPGGRQLSSSTVGIVGCGHVGQEVARLCRAFGATVLGHDIRAYDDFYRAHGVTPVTLDALLAESDIVTLHVPLDPSTRGLIDSPALARMKPTAHLINTARGGIVNEAAVARALTEGRLGGAAFDVFSDEPPRNQELLSLPNFIGTPHIGGGTTEAVLAMGRAAIEGLDDASRQIFDRP